MAWRQGTPVRNPNTACTSTCPSWVERKEEITRIRYRLQTQPTPPAQGFTKRGTWTSSKRPPSFGSPRNSRCLARRGFHARASKRFGWSAGNHSQILFSFTDSPHIQTGWMTPVFGKNNKQQSTQLYPTQNSRRAHWRASIDQAFFITEALVLIDKSITPFFPLRFPTSALAKFRWRRSPVIYPVRIQPKINSI